MALYFPDAVCYELTVFFVAIKPMKGYRAIQPTLDIGGKGEPHNALRTFTAK